MKIVLLLMILFPLLGAAYHALFGQHVARRRVEVTACSSIIASFAAALLAFLLWGRETHAVAFFNWFTVGDFSAAMSVLYDPLAAVMALMVTLVSALIHVYSVGYMRDDADYARYFCYLNLFVFSMLVIILADNLIFLFLGWEGVGFCSYALIGFWYADVARAAAGRKAFLLTRIGDVAFGIAIGVCFVVFGSLSISHINGHAAQLTGGMATILGLLLLWSAIGKSAQLPLVVWLPDAMAGPTPVSALIHAATMVTAGIYLLMRLFPVVVLSPTALAAIAGVGVLTAFYAACSALAQSDIKRVLAYSTISQLGYMFLAVGAGDIVGGMFFLVSHAFYKALLFLAAGCVIQALHEEHDIYRMGAALRGRLPVVFWCFVAGALALGAVPPFSGYFAKDRVLLVVFSHGGDFYKVLWAAATVTAFLTTLYTFRLFFIVFFGESQEGKQHAYRPMPRSMTWTLTPLALLALCAGLLNFPRTWSGAEWLAHYLAGIPGALPELVVAEKLEWNIALGGGALSIIAVLAALFLYAPKDIPGWRGPFEPGHGLHDLLCSGFYLDRVYHAVVVRPYRELARVLWLNVDEGGLDRGLVGSGRALATLSALLRLWTNGRLSTYLGALLLGFTLILCALALGL